MEYLKTKQKTEKNTFRKVILSVYQSHGNEGGSWAWKGGGYFLTSWWLSRLSSIISGIYSLNTERRVSLSGGERQNLGSNGAVNKFLNVQVDFKIWYLRWK